MIPPAPGAWGFGLGMSGTSIHIEHTEAIAGHGAGHVGGPYYWHIQDLLITQAELQTAYGLPNGMGLALEVPFRLVRERIEFEDDLRQPYTPPTPDRHHRNGTRARIADPNLLASKALLAGPWTFSAAVGFSIPLGRTESNPFLRDRQGFAHEHFQFGTGTVDPLARIGVMRRMGPTTALLMANTKIPLARNGHGFQAGERFGVNLGLSHEVLHMTRANATLSFDREEAEHWGGVLETEGNLGRSDLRLGAGVSRAFASGLSVTVQGLFSLWSRASGYQADIPAVVSLSVSR